MLSSGSWPWGNHLALETGVGPFTQGQGEVSGIKEGVGSKDKRSNREWRWAGEEKGDIERAGTMAGWRSWGQEGRDRKLYLSRSEPGTSILLLACLIPSVCQDSLEWPLLAALVGCVAEAGVGFLSNASLPLTFSFPCHSMMAYTPKGHEPTHIHQTWELPTLGLKGRGKGASGTVQGTG